MATWCNTLCWAVFCCPPETVSLPTLVGVRSAYPVPTLWDFTGYVVVVGCIVLKISRKTLAEKEEMRHMKKPTAFSKAETEKPNRVVHKVAVMMFLYLGQPIRAWR